MFKIGQKVKINPISKQAKQNYFYGWTTDMDYWIEKIVTISEILPTGCCFVEENIRLWDLQHLSIVKNQH